MSKRLKTSGVRRDLEDTPLGIGRSRAGPGRRHCERIVRFRRDQPNDFCVVMETGPAGKNGLRHVELLNPRVPMVSAVEAGRNSMRDL